MCQGCNIVVFLDSNIVPFLDELSFMSFYRRVRSLLFWSTPRVFRLLCPIQYRKRIFRWRIRQRLCHFLFIEIVVERFSDQRHLRSSRKYHASLTSIRIEKPLPATIDRTRSVNILSGAHSREKLHQLLHFVRIYLGVVVHEEHAPRLLSSQSPNLIQLLT